MFQNPIEHYVAEMRYVRAILTAKLDGDKLYTYPEILKQAIGRIDYETERLLTALQQEPFVSRARLQDMKNKFFDAKSKVEHYNNQLAYYEQQKRELENWKLKVEQYAMDIEHLEKHLKEIEDANNG